MELRSYQIKLHDDILAAWDAGHRNVAAVSPTGSGKTVLFAHVVKEEPGASIVLAHRAELVAQMSLALAREGIRHRVIGPTNLIRLCAGAHVAELGKSFYDAGSKTGVASVQSVLSYKDTSNWFNLVRLWVHDEAHHLLADNMFGKAVSRLPNARGLGVTATLGRLDGKGLGRHCDGVFDTAVFGPTPRELINLGYLSQYKMYCPPSNIHLEAVRIAASGEFNADELKVETRRSTVLGDVVAHYIKYALGKSGLTFADCVANAEIIAENFKAAGVSAEVLTAKTPDAYRANVIRRFKNKQLYQIISVALIDEGFDCPGIEVVSDAAATQSFNRFAQRFGRGLRIMEGKTHMIYLDHVGNTLRLGLPDAPRLWTLNRRHKKVAQDKSDVIPIRICTNPECVQPYLRTLKMCPYCGNHPVSVGRKSIEQVDGDLIELDADTLAVMLGAIDKVNGGVIIPYHASPIVEGAIRKNHRERQAAQAVLRKTMVRWAGAQGDRDISELYRLFYFKFGVDTLTAQTLGAREAGELDDKIARNL
jgi:superfamily II DNA or RNA helicase